MAKKKKEDENIVEQDGVKVNAETGEVVEDAPVRKKKFDLKSYRSKANIVEIEYKPQEWIDMSKGFKEVTRLPGLPIGHMIMNYGRSDVGKTTMLVEAGAKAIEQGILPILIITENKFSWDRAETMGLYEDECLVHSGIKTIEEGWEVCSNYIAQLEDGSFQKETGISDVIFLWDSIGATPSKAELDTAKHNAEALRKVRESKVAGKEVKDTSKHGGMMVTAKVLKEKFSRDLIHKINKTREATCPYNVTMLIVNHAYIAPPAMPGGVATLKPNGGDAIFYSSTLVFRMGGVMSNSSKVTATKDGVDVSFAIKSALVVDKNHITNVAAKGKILCTDHGFIEDDAKVIKEYKEKHRGDWDLVYDNHWDKVTAEE